MCGRYAYAPVDIELPERYGTVNQLPKGFKSSYNVFPTTRMPVIRRQSPDEIKLMRWGLIPFWAKDPSIGNKMINARAEDIEKKPSFRKPVRTRRCLVPATGFYEWKKTEGQKKKIPYYIHLEDQEVISFAGIYDVWRDAEGKEIKSYCIITTEPNGVVRPIHNRMPVVLKKEDETAWLDTDNTQLDDALKLFRPYPDNDMVAYRISTDVNNPRNDNPELIEPVEET